MIPATPIPTGAPTPDPTYQPTGAPTHPPSVGKLHTTDPDFILETLVCMARAVRADGSNCANISEGGSCLRRDATQSHPMCVPLVHALLLRAMIGSMPPSHIPTLLSSQTLAPLPTSNATSLPGAPFWPHHASLASSVLFIRSVTFILFQCGRSL